MVLYDTSRRFSAIVFYLPLHKFGEKLSLFFFSLSLFCMSHLSATLESFKSVKVCPYIVNDFDLQRVSRSNVESGDSFKIR